MRLIALLLVVVAFSLGGTACSLISDLGDYKFGENEADGGVGPGAAPASTVQTSGGGITTSADYKLRVNVGMPQPMGTVVSDDYKAKVGPDAVNPPKKP